MLDARIEQVRLAEAERQVTPAQIAGYYDEHKRAFVLPERREFDIVVTYHRAAAEQARREIESGEPFLSVAARVSVAPPDGLSAPGNRVSENLEELNVAAKSRHGQHLSGSEEEEEGFLQAIFAAKPHALVGPLLNGADYFVFEVAKVTPARLQTLAQAQASIRQTLGARLQRQLSASVLEAFERRWSARTRCRPGFLARQCAQQRAGERAAA